MDSQARCRSGVTMTATVDAKYPTPWVVGPFGCIWVAADVEFKDGRWRETCANPRLVVDTGPKDQDVAELIVSAVNTAANSPALREGKS
jgi:hypothetical protein